VLDLLSWVVLMLSVSCPARVVSQKWRKATRSARLIKGLCQTAGLTISRSGGVSTRIETVKHLPRTDLSGLRLEFDIECDHALDDTMRFDAPKFPSTSWDSIALVAGPGEWLHAGRTGTNTALRASDSPRGGS